MATTTSTRGALGHSAPKRAESSMHPARKRLILAVVLVLVGSFLPWLYVGGVPQSGALGPGLWTMYAAVLGLAAILMPWRRASGWHAVVVSGTCLAIPVWQVLHIYGKVGFAGWAPGPGIVMVLFGGIIAGQCARQLLRESATTP